MAIDNCIDNNVHIANTLLKLRKPQQVYILVSPGYIPETTACTNDLHLVLNLQMKWNR